MYNLIYHPEADREVIESAKFYESKVEGLGVEFLQELDKSIDNISFNPTSWQVFQKDIHQYIMKRFPFIICYLVSKVTL